MDGSAGGRGADSTAGSEVQKLNGSEEECEWAVVVHSPLFLRLFSLYSLGGSDDHG